MKKKLIVLVGMSFFCGIFFVSCANKKKKAAVTEKKTSLPDDLMYEGKPISPVRVVATQYGDGSRFEPKPCKEESERSGDPEYELLSCEDTFDRETGIVSRQKEYRLLGNDYTAYDSYQYIGTYEGKHIVWCKFYDTSGSGSVTILGIVKREGDTIVNAGEIACGGSLRVESFKDGVLEYWQSVTPDMFVRALSDESLGCFFSQREYGPDVLYQVDLSGKPDEYKQYMVQAMKVDFDYYQEQGEWFAGEYSHTEHGPKECFYGVVNEYLAQHKKVLDIEQAHEFIDKVVTCVCQHEKQKAA